MRAAEEAKGSPLTKAERNQVIRDGPAVAIPDKKHTGSSPTYGGRNTPEQIAEDAANPGSAVKRDSDAMVKAADNEYKRAARAAAKWIKEQQE